MLIMKPIKILSFWLVQDNSTSNVSLQLNFLDNQKLLHGTKRCIQHLEHTLFCSIGIFCNYANGRWHEAWGGKLWVLNVLQPFLKKEVQDNCAYIISQHVVKFLGSRCLSLHQELLSRTHAPSLSTVDWNHLIKSKKSILFSTRQGWDIDESVCCKQKKT